VYRLRLKRTNAAGPPAAEAARLLARELLDRAGIEVVNCTDSPDVILSIEPGLKAEAYRISRAEGGVCVAGGDPAGLLYGVGRFLHESTWSQDGIVLCDEIAESTPDCRTRGMYFAHNFHNWYRSAPLPDLVRYVEDLALWGLNAIAFPCDTNPHCAVDEIENVMLPKQMELIKAARRLGIRIGMITVANTILTKPESEIAATPVVDTEPARRGNRGNRVCPSNPEGLACLTTRYEKSLDAYAAVGLDFVIAFPYDEGGCGCEQCRPWGGNGYVKACKALSRLTKAKYPDCRFIAGTWCFDVLSESEGEYQALDRSIREDSGWCDGTMCDSHGDYPRWPLENGSPGGLPIVNFPEISMWGRWPWGGYGANPFPRRIAGIWRQANHLLDGGFPYSEGRFEDINKIMCLSMFWNKEADWREVLRTYIRYYFGDCVVNDVLQAITMMEEAYPRDERTCEKATGILELIDTVDSRLPASVRNSWRWRLLYLRAVIDMEAASHPDQEGVVSDKQNVCFEELIRLYCAENAESSVRPLQR
jgi:hypothetical protein